MGYKLKSGDQIHVTTDKNQKPNEAWLKLVVTGKARSKIRSAMKEEKKRKGQYGMETLQRKLKNMKADFEENVDKLVQHFGLKSRADLYYAIALNEIPLQDLKTFRLDGHRLVMPQEEVKAPKVDKKAIRRRRESLVNRKPRIIIDGEPAEQYSYTLAGCCKPVQGDEIFAYTSTASGMKIHRTTCPNATNLMANYGYRIMKAEWDAGIASDFVVDLLITGVDDGPGVIERVTNKISSAFGINIRSFSIEGSAGYFEGKVSLVVINTDQLNRLIRGLKSLDGISNVTRQS